MPIIIQRPAPRQVSVKLNRSSLGLYQQSGLPVSIQSQVIASVSMSQLSDVDYGTPAEGYMLVFNASTEKWEAREVDLGDFEFPATVDGGTY